jgi:hypothetical protein
MSKQWKLVLSLAFLVSGFGCSSQHSSRGAPASSGSSSVGTASATAGSSQTKQTPVGQGRASAECAHDASLTGGHVVAAYASTVSGISPDVPSMEDHLPRGAPLAWSWPIFRSRPAGQFAAVCYIDGPSPVPPPTVGSPPTSIAAPTRRVDLVTADGQWMTAFAANELTPHPPGL